MKKWPLALFALLFSGCVGQTGGWDWQRGENAELQKPLAEAIEECERYASAMNTDGNFEGLHNPRPYGGWGNFDFEYCMRKNGWELKNRGEP